MFDLSNSVATQSTFSKTWPKPNQFGDEKQQFEGGIRGRPQDNGGIPEPEHSVVRGDHSRLQLEAGESLSSPSIDSLEDGEGLPSQSTPLL
jgi:hypothetical protein